MALLGIPAGSVVQRLGPKTSMLVADAARAPIVAVVPFLNAVGGLSFTVILVVAALLGTFGCAYFTCQRLILPAVVGEGEQRLAQANSLVEGAGNVTNLLGPALAGDPDRVPRRGERDVARRRVVPDRVRPSSACSCASGAGCRRRERRRPTRAGSGPGWRISGTTSCSPSVSLSSLTFGFLFPMLGASLPVLAYQQYDHNPRVAGLPLRSHRRRAAWSGSLLAFRLVTRMPGMRLAAIAAFFTAAPLWLLVPHALAGRRGDRARGLRRLDPADQRAVPGDALGARAARAARQGAAVADHDQPARRAARIPAWRERCSSQSVCTAPTP